MGDAADGGAAGRGGYPRFVTLNTRWNDNDSYGHVNNVVYYVFFDTAVNRLLIEAGVLDIKASPVIGFVAETGCRYRSPISYPDEVHVGVRVARLGRTSVRYETALFRNDDEAAAAAGHFVHVYVERATGKPTAMPDDVRAFLATLAPPDLTRQG